MIISIDEEKHSTKYNILSWEKPSINWRDIPQHDKGHVQQQLDYTQQWETESLSS